MFKPTFGNGNPVSAYASHYSYRKQWYEKNKEKCHAQMKKYAEEHKEEIKEYKRIYFQRTYLHKGRYGHKNNTKRVRQYDIETNELLGEYESIKDAAYDNYIDKKTIPYAIKNNNGICKKLGCRFEYVGETNE